MAARSFDSLTISFGLITIPLGICSAVREDRVTLRTMCPVHESPIEQATVCKAGGETLTRDEVVKGYEVVDGEYVILTEEELEQAALPVSKTFQIEACVPVDALDPRFFQKPYFLRPKAKDPGTTYILLREALRASDRMGIGKVAIRTRQHLAALTVLGDALVLQLLYWPEELIEMGEYAFPAGVADPDQLALALQLVAAMPSAFDPARFPNQYRVNVEALIAARLEGKPAPFEKAPEPEATGTTSLLQLLQASLARTGHAEAA